MLNDNEMYEMTDNDCYSEVKHKKDTVTEIGTTLAANPTNRPWIRCCGLMGAFLLFVFLLNIGAVVTLFYYQMKMASEISRNSEMLQTINTNRSAGMTV